MFSASSRRIATLAIIVLISIFFLSPFSCTPCSPQIEHRIVIERPSLCRTASVFRCEHCIPDLLRLSSIRPDLDPDSGGYWTFDTNKDARKYGLTDGQCDVAFPGLFEDISILVQQRKGKPITKELLKRTAWPNGTLHVMVFDNELYIIDHKKPQNYGVRAMATLQALYRAIITSPTSLPNVEFLMTVNDFADDPGRLIWSYTRTADDINTWLMPDFGYWSYGEPQKLTALGSWAQVQQRMRIVDEEYSSFSTKIRKAFWRGETALAEDLRTELLRQTYMQPWADVKHLQLRFGDKIKSREDAIPIHEHCKFMFLIHTEGNSYSGRLKYLQNCRSVIFAHTIEWIQPFEYLMVSSGPKQNYVEVARDFSDLAEKVEYYLKHLEEAERIANNSVMTFRDRYHTPAAETCYWRKLILGWREVSFEPEFYHCNDGEPKAERLWRGTPFQNYALRRQTDHFGADSR